jgi:hypothetical protein
MSEALSNLSHEERSFPPPPEFARAANATEDLYAEAEKDPVAFWEKRAERLTWTQKWSQGLDWSDKPFAKWFVGGSLNVDPNHDAQLPRTGVSLDWERLLSSAFVRSPEYGTRCSSILLIDRHGGVRFSEWSWDETGALSSQVEHRFELATAIGA